jgi:two-component system, chemotaxis family, protein-glutamate methylesterase/glutaminase
MTRPPVPADWSAARSARFDVVVVAASAGGVQALSSLVALLPAGFGLPVVIVQHVDARHRSLLVEILQRHANLPVEQVEQGTMLRSGTIFIAPPGWHAIIQPDGSLSLNQAELVHFVRPSADVLFGSAAESFADGVIAVVLTGTGEDGADGVRAVHERGGTVIAQDEGSSEFFGMPGAAIATGVVDHVVPLDDIADTLVQLAAGSPR